MLTKMRYGQIPVKMMELPSAMMNMDVWTMKRERTLESIFAPRVLSTVCKNFCYIRQRRNEPHCTTATERKCGARCEVL